MSNTKPSLAIDTSNDPLIVIVSNRGPYKFIRDENGNFSSKRGAGGLVTALAALAEQLDVLWIAMALSEDDKAWAAEQGDDVTTVDGIDLKLVVTDEDAYNKYYNLIANPLLWFIQHGMWDMTRNPVIDRDIWDAWETGYKAVNQQFAETIIACIAQIRADDDNPDRPVIIMPQDYHLYLVPHYLRERMSDDDNVQIQPFVHIPWPGPDGWRILPESMRNTLLSSLMESDRIGFQTQRDAFNFVQTARFYVQGAHSYGSRDAITFHGRRVEAKTYPISVDVEKVQSLVDDAPARLHKNQIINTIGDRKLILRVDRVEPSKNILRGLQAYRALLEDHPEHHGNVSMMALLVPSRMEVDEYQEYLKDMMAEAGLINAEYSDEYWQPVTIILGNNYPRALAAMALYNVLLVNPIADGMNLVAKEGVLVNTRDGVLVLSEHAGAFYELGEHALTVSPFDVYSTAKAMHEALIMPEAERQTRARALRETVSKNGVREWFAMQVQDALDASMASASKNAKNSSTPATPSTVTSADSSTIAGVSSEATPTPNA